MIPTQVAQKLISLGIVRYDSLSKSYHLNPVAETLGWEISYGYEHVAIKQKKNQCTSRLDVDTESEVVRGIKRPVPMIAANMSTVCDSSFCIALHKQGALGILHRAAPEEVLLAEVAKIAYEVPDVAASIGVGETQKEFTKSLVDSGVNIICIDIAHGYSDSVIEMGRWIKNKYPHVKVIIGNTTNVQLLIEAASFADAIKVGIAQGAACETKNTAGCTEKQFSATLKFKEVSKKYGIPVISDGGIREPADMVKSIGAGANSIMAGSVFARCPESAAPVMHMDGKDMKLYAGMASRWVQNQWKGGLKDGTCPEGGVRYLEMGEPLEKLITRWTGALKSGITYGGGNDVKSFQHEVEFVRLAT